MLAGLEDLRLLRAYRSFRVLAARRSRDARGSVLVVPSRSAEPAAARARLEALARAHASIRHPAVPAARLETTGDGAHVVLEVPAVADGFEVLHLLTDHAVRIPYSAADAFVVGLREGLQAAHGAGVCLGRICAGNVLFDAHGRAHLLGFGANVACEDEHGRPDPATRFFQAPELAGGGEPTPMGDYVALLSFARSIVPHVDLPPALAALLRGSAGGPVQRALARAVRWTETRVVAELPGLRASLDEALRAAAQIRALLGISLDRDGLARIVAELVARREADGPDERAPFVVASDGSWLSTHAAGRRRVGPAQRRIVLALVERHAMGDESPITTSELFELGWPGEAPDYEVGMNRVHAAVSRLRKLGLGDAVERFDAGYRLSPRAAVRRLRAPA